MEIGVAPHYRWAGVEIMDSNQEESPMRAVTTNSLLVIFVIAGYTKHCYPL